MKFNMDVVCMHIRRMGQEPSDLSEFGNVAVRWPIATDPTLHKGEMRIDQMTTERIESLRRELVRRRIGWRITRQTITENANVRRAF